MAQLSYLSTGVKTDNTPALNIPTDESIGAMLFDISGFDNPFNGYPLLYNCFKDNTIQSFKNMDEAELLGITNDGFLDGLLYYHVSQFFDFIGGDQTVYVAIADCSKSWDVIQSMQQQAKGKLFQIGVWTPQCIWRRKDNDTISFTSLITDLQAQADEINGKVGISTHSMVPLNIILFGNSAYIDGQPFTYKDLPDAIQLECPKVSVILAQNGSVENKAIQNANPRTAPVTTIGLAMACLALCGAEESIASIEKCDLNKNEGFNFPELGVGTDSTPLDSVNEIWANTISSLGYIIPTSYESIEASYFFTSDQTLSNGQLCSIANNRVIHKGRRAICTVLMPYVNASHIYDPGTRNISITSITAITDSMNTLLDSVMRNKRGFQQLDSRQVTFLSNDDIMEDDAISLRLEIQPANYSAIIEEEVTHDFT